MSKPIVLFSGGLDSTVLLWRERQKHPVKALSFNYGQRHSKELEHAIYFCNEHLIEHEVCDLGFPVIPRHNWKVVADLIASGSQTGNVPVPEGHYAEESMKQTIVPNRNMIMISIAVGWAVATSSQKVMWAAHAGDHAIYPDCRPLFFETLRDAIVVGNEWTPVALSAPFIHLTKAEIVKMGYALKAPMELSYSCYKGQERHCGKCGTCVERKEAFQLAGVPDPTLYEEAPVA